MTTETKDWLQRRMRVERMSTEEGWLWSRGGRLAREMESDGLGKYVLMTNGKREMVKVYLPEQFQ